MYLGHAKISSVKWSRSKTELRKTGNITVMALYKLARYLSIYIPSYMQCRKLLHTSLKYL
jgi:hypothetical protein